jgi:sugar lactone lactonase YvrE
VMMKAIRITHKHTTRLSNKRKKMAMKINRLIFLLLTLLLSVLPAYSQFTTGQSAEFVAGQPFFGSNTQGTTSTTMQFPCEVAIDAPHGKMYVADYSNNRVLRFVFPLTGDGAAAEMVFGQANMTSGSANRSSTPAANTLNGPWGITVNNGDLWVSEYKNHRIVKYASAYNALINANATVVIGQSGFTTGSANVSQSGFNYPKGLAFDASGNLWVTDYSNNRVLQFASADLATSNANASKVLGQTLYTTNTFGTSNTTFKKPAAVCFDGTTMWVTDGDNNRVLRFDNAASKANGDPADGVLGQADFNVSTFGSNAAQLYIPGGVVADGNGTLYVADPNNSRVKIYLNAKSKTNGADADYVLGQTTVIATGTGTTANTMNNPVGVALDQTNRKVIVSDQGNSRVIQFSGSSALPVELTTFTANISGSIVSLHWNTATEVNNYGFEVERAIDNGQLTPQTTRDAEQREIENWSKIGFVEGNGTTNAPKSYSFTDKSASRKTSYRLKQIDRDGKFEYSQIVEVTALIAPKEFGLEQNYPNPFNPTTMISYQLPASNHVSLKVFDLLGKEVATLVNETKEAGTYSAKFDASKLPSGIYFARLSSNGKSQMRKLLLTK